VAAHGTHDELMNTTPQYRELVEAFETDRADPATESTADASMSAGGGA
jgi:hypothetical protein